MANPYLWVVILAGIVCFAYGFFIGANDVANAFASSVSSKSLTLRQAVVCAGIFEFLGAITLGAAVTNTVRSKIIDIDLYEDEPYVLMFGMFTSLLSANIVLGSATYLALPVSTTHDIVGCIMGFSIAAKGFASVEWDVAKKLFLSWILSPLIAGTAGFVFFGLVKVFILTSNNAYERAFYLFPLVLTVGIGIDLFYVLYKAFSTGISAVEEIPVSTSLPVAFGVGLFCGLLWIYPFGPIVKRRIEAEKVSKQELEAAPAEADPEQSLEGATEKVEGDGSSDQPDAPTPATPVVEAKEDENPGKKSIRQSFHDMAQSFADNTVNQDLHAQAMTENARSSHIWENAKDYEPDAERLFNFIQVFTACLNSFAHGSNDVANAIAPFSATYAIYLTGTFESKSPVPKWILAFGGIAIVIGLLLYGYRVMKSIGFKLTKLSPSRGASAELAASLTVVTASFLEIPVSSTQCIVGAVSGVGLVHGPKEVNWWFLLRVMVGWVVNFFMAALISAGIFAFAFYSPRGI